MLKRTRSLVSKNKRHERSHHRSAKRSGFSCAIGFNGFLRALSGDRAFLPPSQVRCASIITHLMPASRHQDHTTSPSAIAPLVRRHNCVHRIPRPTSVTIAKRPSDGCGTTIPLLLFLPTCEAKYFSLEGWTGISLICPSGKSDVSAALSLRSAEATHCPGAIHTRAPPCLCRRMARQRASPNGLVNKPPRNDAIPTVLP